MYHVTARVRAFSTIATIAALWPVLSSCLSVNFVSDYDKVTDQSLTSLQQKTDDFIVALQEVARSPEAGFDRHAAFYANIDRDLRQLEFRVASIPNNRHTQQLVSNIRTVLLGDGTGCGDGASLRALHCNPENYELGPSMQALEISRRNINQTISAALSLEFAKKQGRDDTE